MTTTAAPAARPGAPAPRVVERHPKGLYVLFATEMWERFGFYSMLALFTLYLKDPDQGFGWNAARATTLYANYLMFVYASPLIGGWIADRKLGYRNSVILGGLIYMVGYSLFLTKSMTAVYAALVCLVVGNGFFKPNVSAMVGNLYPEGSHLKDRAYNIFYMGINVGAFIAPLVAEAVRQSYGFRPAFAVASIGMILAVGILWAFKHHVVDRASEKQADSATRQADSAAVTEDAPPSEASQQKSRLESVPEARRIAALLVVYAIVIVFWMVFHQNGSTLTYWANDNTDWTASAVLPAIVKVLSLGTVSANEMSGVVSNSINPFFIITLTFPLVAFWKALDRRGIEPATPTKMMIGMLLTGTSFFILYLGAINGGNGGRVSPWWLVGAYAVLSTGELMLSPMGLSLVSKVAPVRLRGLMMGGWFVATAIGNKLTQIGVLWDRWPHSKFFALLGGMAIFMAFVLLLLLKPLKKAMPGV
jgi:POT family proton-dependent oligopeptide transporter